MIYRRVVVLEDTFVLEIAMIGIMKFKETRWRSLTKSMTFRISIVISDLVLVYALTKRADITIAVTVLTNAASTILYFAHERIWNSLGWGRRRIG